ncbi:MAG: hypothetical protein COA67_08270 [Lutibacter sp.]|nr:MAG: hypothetical protein COA67_08270 [Lutibacter sp.]
MAHAVFSIYILIINHPILKVMKTIYIYIIILLGLLQFTNINGQTITKTASKSSVYIGEKFTYTIAIENINNFSDLDQIVDDFGLDTDILAVRYGPSIQLLSTWQFCSGISDITNTTSTSNELVVTFNNCSGSTSMINRLYIEVDVRLNERACSLTTKDNIVDLVLKNPARTISAQHSMPIDYTNPLVLQKSFFKYDNGYLYYDVRLSSKTGNFRYIDFSTQSFLDEFTLPSCFQNVSASDIETVYHPNGVRAVEVPITPNSPPNISGNQLSIDWSIPSSVSVDASSILFAVKIKVADCQCNNLFDLRNTASFKFQNVCGTPFNMTDSFDLEGLTCDIENSLPSDCTFEFNKTYKLKGNDLGLTMKGCEGEYTIDLKNCSTNLKFGKILLSDLVPTELDILGIDSGAWSHNLTGNQMTLNAHLSPGDSLQVKIKFKVNTNIPNKIIENCANIDIWGNHMYTNAPIQFSETSCTDFKTVPNEVTVVTKKSICSTAEKDCGTLEINSNFNNINYLPNDDVEYELFFYNYGNKDGENVVIVDRLPNYLKVLSPSDIKVYKAESGDPALMGNCIGQSGYTDITNSVHINYSPSGLNQLDIKLDNHILDAFTCKGVSFYKVVVKGKIQQTAQSGIYDCPPEQQRTAAPGPLEYRAAPCLRAQSSHSPEYAHVWGTLCGCPRDCPSGPRQNCRRTVRRSVGERLA